MTKPSPPEGPRKKLLSRQIFIPFLLLVCFVLGLTACAGSGTTQSQPAGITATASGTTLYLTPASIDFGNVKTNSERATRALSLTNTGRVSVNIDSASISPTAAFSIWGSTVPVALAPAETVELYLAFAPTTNDTYSGTLTIVTSPASSTKSLNPVAVSSMGFPAVPQDVNLGVLGRGYDDGRGQKGITVSVSPNSVTLQSGQSMRFAAKVTGTNNAGVTWSAARGSISSSGLYTAPSETSQTTSQTIDTVSATSVADPTKYATASVVIQSKAGITVFVSPNAGTLQSGQSMQFAAKVTGTNNAGVTWSAALGSISASGLYTAPTVAIQTTDTVSATSMADPTKYAAASVVIRSKAGITVFVSPNAGTLQSGQSMQFAAKVTGTNNVGVTWTAALGSITSSGLYTAPKVASQTSDTVSVISAADPTKYATAQVEVQRTDGDGVWTVENQQPVTQQFYPGSIFTTPLPADAGSHLYPNSDAIVNNMFGGDSNGSGATSSITSTLPSNGGHNSQKGGFYYASQSDPLFKIVSVSAPPANSQYSPLGLYFHMTSGATWDSDFGDENLVVWDQSTDIDSTPGGRIITSYFYNGGTYQVRSLPTNCTATTPAQADAQPQCQLSWYYTSFDYPFNQLTPWNTDDSWSSMNDSNGARYVRLEEIMQNTINHAIPLNYQCGKSSSGNGIADGYVFPAYGAAAGCKFVDNLRPLDGNWFYIDSGYNCGSLPLWQQPICTAMQTYGGYIADTGGDGNGLYVRPLEGGMAASTAGVNSRFFNSLNTGTPAWIITNGGLSCPGGGYPKTCTGSNGLAVVEDSATVAEKVVLKFFNMPGVLSHIHIIDPCVVKRLAGEPGAC